MKKSADKSKSKDKIKGDKKKVSQASKSKEAESKKDSKGGSSLSKSLKRSGNQSKSKGKNVQTVNDSNSKKSLKKSLKGSIEKAGSKISREGSKSQGKTSSLEKLRRGKGSKIPGKSSEKETSKEGNSQSKGKIGKSLNGSKTTSRLLKSELLKDTTKDKIRITEEEVNFKTKMISVKLGPFVDISDQEVKKLGFLNSISKIPWSKQQEILIHGEDGYSLIFNPQDKAGHRMNHNIESRESFRQESSIMFITKAIKYFL